MQTIYCTISLCPECLAEIPARIEGDSDAVHLSKTCPKHGSWQTVIWEDSLEHYCGWLKAGGLDPGTLPQSLAELSADSRLRQTPHQPVSAAVMVTDQCNLACPVCFTKSAQDDAYQPTTRELKGLIEEYRARAGRGAPLEFCGGEPTVRQDLPALASFARDLGFDYIQLNTNGLRLAAEPDYAGQLAKAGITTVYLGFDGLSDAVYHYKYGRRMLPDKQRAIENCAAAGLAVVLVPCVIPGVNDQELGAIIDYARRCLPTVRGVYFQPLSQFGILPPGTLGRMTLPRLIREIVRQSGGTLQVTDFLPGALEHPQCSFQAYYLVGKNGRLHALTRFDAKARRSNVQAARARLRQMWLAGENQALSIGGMGFMDVATYDRFRICHCTVQVMQRSGHLMPLCEKYVTNRQGARLHPGIS